MTNFYKKTIIDGVSMILTLERNVINMEENKEILLTQEGYDNLEKELEYLKSEKRTEMVLQKYDAR